MTQYRYTDRALRSLSLARDDARLLGHAYIGTEHLLLGLIQEKLGTAAKIIDSTGVTRDQVLEKIRANVGRASSQPGRHVPFTPRTKKVLRLAQTDSVNSGSEHIGTEHLLVGLLNEGDGLAIEVLKQLHVDLGKLRQKAASRRY